MKRQESVKQKSIFRVKLCGSVWGESSSRFPYIFYSQAFLLHQIHDIDHDDDVQDLRTSLQIRHNMFRALRKLYVQNWVKFFEQTKKF